MTIAETVQDHYKLKNLDPVTWPAEKDESDDSADEAGVAGGQISEHRRSKSKNFAVLNRASSDRRSIPGAERGVDGVENLVQKDEPDPLGTADSVVRALRSYGLPVEDNARLRNRFLLSSTTFSPAMFLSQVHANASTRALHEGADFLSRSIDQKSASLKVLVESNFELFVRAKATIDNVYEQMSKMQKDSDTYDRTHSRHTSRSSAHFRNSSGTHKRQASGDERKKNTLTKEDEYGVAGIKGPLLDAAVKAEEVWGPALGGREREDALKSVLVSIEKFKGVYEAAGIIADCIKRKEYESLVEEFTKAKRYRDEARDMSTKVMQTQSQFTDAQVHQIIITGRMWLDVEEQIEAFKKDIWRRLAGIQTNVNQINPGTSTQIEEHLELIGILLELGVEDNPIWVWLLSRYDYLKSKIAATADRFRVEIEILRRRLSNGPKPTAQSTAIYLRASERSNIAEKTASLDSIEVIEFWERVYSSMKLLLASQGGILGEVIDFRDTAQSFIDGKAQKSLPTGIDGQSQHHHRLSVDGTKQLQDGANELISLTRDLIFSFFADPPIEDISSLFSPMPPTPHSPLTPQTPGSLQDPRFRLDPKSIPPMSPKVGEAWETFAFWPPHANSLSGVHYLSRIMVLIGTAASEMAAMNTYTQASNTTERLRSLVSGTRERCVQAVCAAWNKDAENCKVLEDWTKSPEERDLTKMPSFFRAFESAVLSGMQKILYISEAMTKPGVANVVTPPPAKLLQMVRSQFVTSLYKALSGMVANAEKPLKTDDDEWSSDLTGLTNPVTSLAPSMMTAHSVNANDRNVRMLLTLSNLHSLRTDVVPSLISSFETFFSVKLTDESKTIHDVLGQIDARLFASYTRPTVSKLSEIIHEGIESPTWPPKDNERPTEVRPYIYTSLLTLVLVHTQVSTTAASLTSQVLSFLLEQCSAHLLVAFKTRSRYSLAALMQATLDVEFVAQTLSQYTSTKAGELQSQIYLELDKGTDDSARKRLQKELPEMRRVLKSLRDGSRAEFACFKKQRSQRDRPERQPSENKAA